MASIENGVWKLDDRRFWHLKRRTIKIVLDNHINHMKKSS